MKEIKPETEGTEKEELERGYYYRTIARHLILRRGAPFLLSPREIDLIARWEAASIPLPVVLEAIDRAMEKAKRRKRPTTSFSLLMCEKEVEKAYEQHRDRLVGRAGRDQVKDKYKDVLREVETFLEKLPSALINLKPILLRAIEIIKMENKQAKEKQLEELEEEIENELIEAASNEEKQEVRIWMEKEFPNLTGQAKEDIFKTALIKWMWRKYKVPHLLSCYY